MFLLGLDTETTGLPQEKIRWPYTWDKIQASLAGLPHVVEVGLLIVEYETGNVVDELHVYVSDSPKSEPGAQAVHQISQTVLEEKGIASRDMLDAVDAFAQRWKNVDGVIGYNVRFDLLMMMAACVRCGKKVLFRSFEQWRQLDVMKMVTPLVDKRHPQQNFVVSPKLSEALHFLFPSRSFDDLHSAVADIRATVEAYAEVQRRYPKYADVLGIGDTMSSEQRQIFSKFLFFSRADILVDAVPGAGKTFLMINIIVRLLGQRGKERLPRHSICLLTYNRALADMYALEFAKFGIPNLQARAPVYHASTIDSLCRKILGQDHGLANYAKILMANPSPTYDSLQAIKSLKYVFLDEYQDFKEEHMFLLRMLVRLNPHIRWFAAGDIRQTLYGEMGAMPMEMREFRKWKFETIRTTHRCSGVVVDFCNAAFGCIDWDLPENAKWSSVRSVFADPQAMVGSRTEEVKNVSYKKFYTGRLQSTEEMLTFLVSHAQDILSRCKTDTVSVLSPTTNSAKARAMLLDIELHLSRQFGPAFVFRREGTGGGGGGGSRGRGGGGGSQSITHQHSIEVQSIHSSKGLTIDHVFLICFFECPSDDPTQVDWSFQCRSVQSCIKAFVAGSRARKSLVLVHNVVKGTRCMPTLRTIQHKLDVQPTFDDFEQSTRERTEQLLSVAEAVDKHRPEFKQSVSLLDDFKPGPIDCVCGPFQAYKHPFLCLDNAELSAQLGNDMLWAAYSQFLKAFVRRSAGIVDNFPCWMSDKEFQKCGNVRENIPRSVVERHMRITKQVITDETELLRVTETALNAQVDLFARYAEVSRSNTPSALWIATRIMRYPDKSLLSMFDFSDEQLTPPDRNFWQDATKVLDSKRLLKRQEGYQEKWNCRLGDLQGTFRNQPILVRGRVDLVFYKDSHVEIWNFVCVVQESRLVDPDHPVWCNVHLLQEMAAEAYPGVPSSVYVYSTLSGCVYQRCR